jgi:hypothetical protein
MNSRTGNKGMGATGGNKIPKGYEHVQMQNFTPEMMQLFQQLFGNLGPDSFLSKLAGGDQATFDKLEAPALQQFQGLQGQTASRFSGMGTGAQHSSGFKNTMNQASSDFAQQLQSNRIGLQQGALQQLHELSNSLLQQRPYEQGLVEKQGSGWMKFLESILGGAAGGFGQGFGGKAYNKWFG